MPISDPKLRKIHQKKQMGRLYGRRLELGLCVRCGKTNDRLGQVDHRGWPRTACSACAAKLAAFFRRTLEKRKKDRKCLHCGRERVRGTVHCYDCLERISEKGAEIRKLKRERGICCSCSMPLSTRSKWRCDSCLDRQKLRGRARRASACREAHRLRLP